MDALCLTLGHNSSAILIRDGLVMAGYETERLTGVKSDSSFPQLPIEQINRFFHIAEDVEIFIGHWALDGKLSSMSPKHWNPLYIKESFPKALIRAVDENFTHHDSHAYSGICFSGWENDAHIFVMDGFGTFGEHMSVYKLINKVPVLQWRKFGLGTSLGLLYQYTTGYLGMKQNQDEYKLLAFESHIGDYIHYFNYAELKRQIARWADFYLDKIDSSVVDGRTDPLCNIGALPEIANIIAGMHNQVLRDIGADRLDSLAKKIIVAYFTQSLVERILKSICASIEPNNLILVGGLFYNVKLNNMLSTMIPGQLCVMPLAGDQGCGLGMYHATHGLKWPENLYWGHRRIERPESLPSGLHYFDYDGTDSAIKFAADILGTHGFVSLVRGSMEFGPRALCHTSTIARPTKEVAAYINKINARTNEMPYAPVVSMDEANRYFSDVWKIHKSLEYMIVTRDFKDTMHKNVMGAAHYDHDRRLFTGRPQISTDSHILNLLKKHPVLINTSYNFHGVPIVYNLDQVLYTHTRQVELSDVSRKPVTIIVN